MAAIDWIDGSGPARPAALVMSAAVTLAGLHAAFARGPAPGLAMLLLMVAGAVIALVLLVRAELPPAARGAAAGAILVALICCSVRSDPFGGAHRRAAPGIDGATTSGPADAAGGGTTSRTGSGAGVGLTGATVSLDGGGWADGAVAALSGRVAEDVAGAAAWRIAGSLSTATDPDRDGRIAVSIQWGIAGAAGEARCGTLAVLATNASQLDAALDDAFAAAVRRSARRVRAFCG